MGNTNSFSWPEKIKAAISLSFDDGRRSQIEVGMPLFEELDMRATFYVTPKALIANVEKWQQAVEFGHEIANHTTTHPCSGNFTFMPKELSLEEMTLADIEKDILNCTAVIKEHLGITPTTFAYPCGQKFVGRGVHLNSYVPVIARHFAIGRGFRDEWHNDPVKGDPAQVFGMDSDRSDFEVIRPWIDRAIDDGGWLVLAGHDIGDSGQQTTLVDTIRQIADYAKNAGNGLWVDTVDAVGKYILDHR